jgi:hypothetical protein
VPVPLKTQTLTRIDGHPFDLMIRPVGQDFIIPPGTMLLLLVHRFIL